jgi:magnesium chelatase family protein
MLVAAMNPCACGYFGDPKRDCRCTPTQIQGYRNRLSGPLLDRIDLHVEVPAIRYQDLAAAAPGEASALIRQRVIAARGLQQERFRTLRRVHNNAGMRTRDIQKWCGLTSDAQDVIKQAITQLNFSARAYDRILKVARTIADLAGLETIEPRHVSEAIQYRALDRNLWV